jgi:CheY-like chemotaxis protein
VPRILAVDDSATMRKILEMTFIGQDGIQLGAVSSGESALKAAEGGVDLIILDVGMPGMDGYEVASALRGHSVTSSVPILFLASEHNPLDAGKAKAAGVDDHVMKPFETQALIDKAKEMLARPRSAGAGAPIAAAPRPAAPAAPAPISLGTPKAPPVAAPVAPKPPAPAAPIPGVVAAKPAAPVVAAPQVGRATASFGAPQGSKPPTTAAPIGVAAGPRPPAAGQPTPIVATPAAKVDEATSEMAGKLSGMGLTPAQVDGVLALSREVIERVVWEVVPTLAETIIREEIKRLTS